MKKTKSQDEVLKWLDQLGQRQLVHDEQAGRIERRLDRMETDLRTLTSDSVSGVEKTGDRMDRLEGKMSQEFAKLTSGLIRTEALKREAIEE